MKFRLLNIRNIIQNRRQLSEQTINSTKEILIEAWLPIALILSYFVIAITGLVDKLAFLPDWLDLHEVDPKEYFGLIIGAIASIFGIVMAVILLTVEVLKERLNRNIHTNPLENQLIRNSIYSSISLIGLSFVAYIQIDAFDNSKYLTLGYFIGIIFIAYIYSVYPVLKKIIGKSSKIKQNADLVDTLSFNSFKNVSRQRFRRDFEQDDRLKVLKSEIDSYIISSNVSAYKKINDDILNKAFGYINDGQIRNQTEIVVAGLVWLWRENCKTAIRVSDTHYFELIWNYIRDVFVYFASKKAPLLHLNDLDFFIYFDFLKLHIKLENSIPLSTALDCIEESFKSNLINNCPKQEDLTELVNRYEGKDFEPTSHQHSFQWDGINHLLSLVNKVQETAISLSDKDIFEESNRRLQSICIDLYYHNYPIGNYQKGYMTWQQLKSSFYISDKALDLDLYENTLDCFEIPKHFFDMVIEQNSIDIKDVRIIVLTLGDYLISAFKKNKLFINTHYGTLHDFYMIGIHCLKFYKTNTIAKSTVNYIIKVLKHLKKLAEKKITSINPNDYLAIKSSLKHFINVAVKYDDFKEDEKPVIKWKNICDSFNDIPEVKDFGIVKWKLKKSK